MRAQQRIAFEPVVDENKRLPLRSLFPFLNKRGARFPSFLVYFLGFVVGFKRLHRFFIFAAWLEEEPGCDEIRVCSTAPEFHLLVYRRHFGPRVEDMGDVVAGKTIKVFWLEPVLVSHFDAVGPAFWELGKERVQRCDKIPAMLVICGIKPGEFKHDEADVRADRFAWFQEGALKHLGVQEMFIRCSGPVSKTWQVWEFLHRNFVGNLEPELKVGWHL